MSATRYQFSLSGGASPKRFPALRTACAARLLPLLLFLTLPAAVQAQFTFTTNNGAITITTYTGTNAVVTIPATTNGYPVTGIADDAFYDCTSLTSLTIPDSVTSIGEEAFAGCRSLTSLTIPDSVTSVGDVAFGGCSSLTSLAIGNGVTNIGEGVFSSCYSLTSVTIPNSVTSIGQSAFMFCTSLGNVTIGSSVINIGEEAFSFCTNLTAVYFQGNAPSADSTAFILAPHPTVYYLPGTTGWSDLFSPAYLRTALWFLPNPLILNNGPSFGVQTNAFGFIISWATNIPVVVEAATNLANPAWSPVATNTLTSGSSYFSDPQWTNYPARFYRLRSP